MANKKLKAARLQKRWSQAVAAEKAGVSVLTYSRWEKGIQTPYLTTLDQLCNAFEMSPKGLGFEHGEASASAQIVSAANAGMPLALADEQIGTTDALLRENTSDRPGSHLQIFVEGDLTLRCLTLVYSFHPHLQDAIAQTIKDYDAMHTNDLSARVTRREALSRLIVLPYALSALGSGLKQIPAREFLAQCTAGVAAAWQHSKSASYEDLSIAFEGVSTYLPTLQHIINDFSQHRQEAAHLAMQCGQLKTILAFHLEGPARATMYAQQGISYATESGDPASQAIAWRQLANSYYYENRRELALEAAQRARFVIDQSQKDRARNGTIPAYVQSWVYSGLAAYQAQHGHHQDALTSLGDAHTAWYSVQNDEQNPDPQDSLAELILWDGMTHSFRGQHNKAMASFEQAIDINDNRQRAKVPMGRRMHVEIINQATLAFLKSPQKDKKFSIELWKAGMQGAKALHSQQRCNEALLAYQIMEGVWPNDPHIEELRELI